MFVGDPVIMRQWPIWMHLQGPSSWMLESSSARWIRVLVNTSCLEATSAECGWETMKNDCITSDSYLCFVCVNVWCFAVLYRSMCVGSVLRCLGAVSYTLLWGAMDLRTVPAMKQQQPCREPLISHCHPTSLLLCLFEHRMSLIPKLSLTLVLIVHHNAAKMYFVYYPVHNPLNC